MEIIKKIWSWVKWLFENKAIIFWIIGLSGIGYQQFVIGEKQQEVVDTQQQVTNVANHMSQHEEVKHLPVARPVAVQRCDCDKFINAHEKEWHE